MSEGELGRGRGDLLDDLGGGEELFQKRSIELCEYREIPHNIEIETSAMRTITSRYHDLRYMHEIQRNLEMKSRSRLSLIASH